MCNPILYPRFDKHSPEFPCDDHLLRDCELCFPPVSCDWCGITEAGFWFHFGQDKIAGKAMADAHLEYYRACDPDFIKVMNDNRYDMPDDMPLIEKAEDWRSLPKNPVSASNYQKQISGLKVLAEELADEAYFTTTVFDPMATGNYISRKQVINQRG